MTEYIYNLTIPVRLDLTEDEVDSDYGLSLALDVLYGLLHDDPNSVTVSSHTIELAPTDYSDLDVQSFVDKFVSIMVERINNMEADLPIPYVLVDMGPRGV